MSLFDSSSKGVKFDTIGAAVTGVVTAGPRERQQTKYGTQEPDFWPNGDPKMQILVDLRTDQRVDANDDGERTLYVASKNMKRAIGEALRASGAGDILPGGTLTVSYIGNDPASKNPANPAKLYQAQYTPPVSAFAQPAPAAAPQAAQTAPTPAPAAPAPVVQSTPAAQQPFAAPQPQAHPSGLSPEQVGQLQQLRAAGIPEATVVTAIGATPEQVAAYDNTPF